MTSPHRVKKRNLDLEDTGHGRKRASDCHAHEFCKWAAGNICKLEGTHNETLLCSSYHGMRESLTSSVPGRILHNY